MECPFKPGDKVRLVATMKSDPAPLEAGSCGTVVEISPPVMDPEKHDPQHVSLANFQLWMEWENGRALCALWPFDELEKVDP